MSAYFAKPAADADALGRAATQMDTASLTFHNTSTQVKSAAGRAAAGWTSSNACAVFLSSSERTSRLALHQHNELNTTAKATRTFAKVVRDVCHAVDGLNRQHNAEVSTQLTLVPGTPRPSPLLPATQVNSRLQREYNTQMDRYTRAAKTYAGALDTFNATAHGPGAKWEAHHLLGEVGKALGPIGVSFLAVSRAGAKVGLKVSLGKSYFRWLSRGAKAEIDLARFSDTAEGRLLQQAVGGALQAKYKDYPELVNVLRGTKPLSKTAVSALSKMGMSSEAISALEKMRPLATKFGLVTAVGGGAYDAATGGGDKGAHGILTRTAGALGAGGGGALLLAAGANPIVDGVAAGALLAYVGYSAGNLIYKDREQIWTTTKKLSSRAAHNVADTAKSDWDAITHPTRILQAFIPHFP